MSDPTPPEPTTEAERASTEAELRLVPPDWTDAPVHYANFAQGAASPYDMTLHFGWFSTPILATPPEGPVEVPVRPLLSVTIPTSIVRGMIRVLEAQLAAADSTRETERGEAG